MVTFDIDVVENFQNPMSKTDLFKKDSAPYKFAPLPNSSVRVGSLNLKDAVKYFYPFDPMARPESR